MADESVLKEMNENVWDLRREGRFLLEAGRITEANAVYERADQRERELAKERKQTEGRGTSETAKPVR